MKNKILRETILAVVLVLFVALWVVAFLLGRPTIESKLQKTTEKKLQHYRFEAISVSFNGRNAILSGPCEKRSAKTRCLFSGQLHLRGGRRQCGKYSRRSGLWKDYGRTQTEPVCQGVGPQRRMGLHGGRDYRPAGRSIVIGIFVGMGTGICATKNAMEAPFRYHIIRNNSLWRNSAFAL